MSRSTAHRALAAAGGDPFPFGLTAIAGWTLGVMEFSGAVGTFRTSASAWTNGLMMGAVAYKTSAGGAESSQWNITPCQDANVGTYASEGSGGGGGSDCKGALMLGGVGKC